MPARFRPRRQLAARVAARVGEQAFVVALQPQEGLRVAHHDLGQAAAGVVRQFGVRQRAAHQQQRGFELARVVLEALAVEGVAAGEVVLRMRGPLAEADAFAGTSRGSRRR